jgi:hypothetical protein
MSLDNFFTEKAKNELRETDTRKAQSLEQFREWISKHAFLQNVRQGEFASPLSFAAPNFVSFDLPGTHNTPKGK